MTSSISTLTPRVDEADGPRPTDRPSLRGDRPVLVVAAGLALWLVGYAVALGVTQDRPVGRLVVQSGLGLLPATAATAVTAVAASRSSGRNRAFWAALAVFTGLSLAGAVVRSADTLAGGLPGWTAGAAVDLHTAAYLAGPVIALFMGGRPRVANRLGILFDLTAVAIAAGYLGYEFSFGPALAQHAGAGVLFEATFAFLDALILLVALSVGVGARHRVPVSRLLVTASVACLGAADAVYSDTVLIRHADEHWLLLVRVLGSCLVVLAGVIALRYREVEGSVRRYPSSWSMWAVFAVTLDVLQHVASMGRAGRLTGRDLLVAGVGVLVLIVRGLMANAEVRAVAVRLEEARAEQERLAVTDGLTGLYNRRFFEEFLRLEGDRSARQANPLSLVVADLDHFKRVNDREGHPAGDRVLVEAAQRLRTAARSSDVIARYGGEEFVIILPETDDTAALEVAERCRHALAAAPVTLAPAAAGDEDRAVAVTGSFGVATLWPLGGDATVADLVRAADRALYRAKATGRNRVAPAGEWDFLTAADEPTGSDSGSESGADTDPITESLLRAAQLVDADQSADEHSAAMARWATVIASAVGLDAAAVARCTLGARLHDVGKLAIPGSILAKPGPLTDAEWTLVRTHPEHSEALVALSGTLADIGPIVRAHHERFDGAGYPDGLSGTSIPVEARIITVCDAWAAMRATRGYTPARSVERSRAEIAAGAGAQFDPDIAATFLRLQEDGLVGDLAPAAVDVTA